MIIKLQNDKVCIFGLSQLMFKQWLTLRQYYQMCQWSLLHVYFSLSGVVDDACGCSSQLITLQTEMLAENKLLRKSLDNINNTLQEMVALQRKKLKEWIEKKLICTVFVYSILFTTYYSKWILNAKRNYTPYIFSLIFRRKNRLIDWWIRPGGRLGFRRRIEFALKFVIL